MLRTVSRTKKEQTLNKHDPHTRIFGMRNHSLQFHLNLKVQSTVLLSFFLLYVIGLFKN